MSASSACVPASSGASIRPTLVPLAELAVGGRARIADVDASVADDLARDGLVPGTEVVVAGRGPLGGATIVEVGRARLAVPSALAHAVRVVDLGACGDPGRATEAHDRQRAEASGGRPTEARDEPAGR